jgi:protein-S-isoprenylcysteine O-methyltransferase Ste14
MEESGKKTMLKLRAWLSGAILYGIALLVYLNFPFYKDFIYKTPINTSLLSSDFLIGVANFLTMIFGNNPWSMIWHLYVYYLICGFLWFVFYDGADIENTKTLIFWRVIKKIFLNFRNFFIKNESGMPDFQITPKEKSIALFFLVKLIYVPLMSVFFFNNGRALLANGHKFFFNWPITIKGQIILIYYFIFDIILTIDTVYFLFGYLFEFKSWKNELRSVEPTFLGWAVALACYPPFNDTTSRIFGWGSTDDLIFTSTLATLIAAIFSISMFFIYVWATVALGTKSSNLTNRGIVSRGPYKYVRHPAYISKNLSWLITSIPVIIKSPFAIISILIWATIYFIRALTEERHLLADPDYQAYCEKVRYRFIPGIF